MGRNHITVLNVMDRCFRVPIVHLTSVPCFAAMPRLAETLDCAFMAELVQSLEYAFDVLALPAK